MFNFQWTKQQHTCSPNFAWLHWQSPHLATLKMLSYSIFYRCIYSRFFLYTIYHVLHTDTFIQQIKTAETHPYCPSFFHAQNNLLDQKSFKILSFIPIMVMIKRDLHAPGLNTLKNNSASNMILILSKKMSIDNCTQNAAI